MAASFSVSHSFDQALEKSVTLLAYFKRLLTSYVINQAYELRTLLREYWNYIFLVIFF